MRKTLVLFVFTLATSWLYAQDTTVTDTTADTAGLPVPPTEMEQAAKQMAGSLAAHERLDSARRHIFQSMERISEIEGKLALARKKLAEKTKSGAWDEAKLAEMEQRLQAAEQRLLEAKDRLERERERVRAAQDRIHYLEQATPPDTAQHP